jgi:hypothetical protein
MFDELSPRELIEYEQTYDVSDVREDDDGRILTAISVESDIEMELRFAERPDGLDYELVRGGPFEELSASLTVHGDDAAESGDADLVLAVAPDESETVRVTMTSEFTFGGRFARVVDWLASGDRRQELERALIALAVESGAIPRPEDLDDGTDADGADVDRPA